MNMKTKFDNTQKGEFDQQSQVFPMSMYVTVLFEIWAVNIDYTYKTTSGGKSIQDIVKNQMSV